MTKILTRSVASRSPFPPVPASCSRIKGRRPLLRSIFNNLINLWRGCPSASVEMYQNIDIESSFQFIRKAWTRQRLHFIMQNPGPSQYDKFAGEDEKRSNKGFSLRPKTANNRNCTFALIKTSSIIRNWYRCRVLATTILKWLRRVSREWLNFGQWLWEEWDSWRKQRDFKAVFVIFVICR